MEKKFKKLTNTILAGASVTDLATLTPANATTKFSNQINLGLVGAASNAAFKKKKYY